jgi:uncharacterized integral membrane protein
LLILAFVLGVLLTVFALQNTEPVSLNFLNYSSGAVPLALTIFLSALVGALLASLLWVRERVQHALDVRRRDRRLRELEAEVHQLRSASTGGTQGTTGLQGGSGGTTVDYTAGGSPQ